MRGIAIPMLAVAAPLIAELSSASGSATAKPVRSEAPPLARSAPRTVAPGGVARNGTTPDDAVPGGALRRPRRTVPSPALLAARLPAHRGGYQVHNGRVALT
jgi:hypothetical protein